MAVERRNQPTYHALHFVVKRDEKESLWEEVSRKSNPFIRLIAKPVNLRIFLGIIDIQYLFLFEPTDGCPTFLVIPQTLESASMSTPGHQ
jgi:hypothetical protein